LTPRTRIAVAAIAAACVFLAWRTWVPNEERAVRQRLDALAADVNAAATGGAAAAVRTAEIGSYFTEDVVLELGEGAAPIVGRGTLVGMAARLARRTASFRMRFDDVGVRIGPGATSADVTLTASFSGHDEGAPAGDAMDAREFTLQMAKTGGVWRIAHVGAVDTLR
jgi:hypothetical protein